MLFFIGMGYTIFFLPFRRLFGKTLTATAIDAFVFVYELLWVFGGTGGGGSFGWINFGYFVPRIDPTFGFVAIFGGECVLCKSPFDFCSTDNSIEFTKIKIKNDTQILTLFVFTWNIKWKKIMPMQLTIRMISIPFICFGCFCCNFTLHCCHSNCCWWYI